MLNNLYQTIRVLVAIYVRLSKDDMQYGDSISIQHQIEMLTKYAQSQGWEVAGIYRDDGFSGTNFKRPSFQCMIEDVKLGKVNCILVNDLSRFGREHVEMGNYIDFVLPSLGCRFVAIRDGVDTIRDDNDIMPVKNIFNEWYARDTSRKIKAVKKNSALKGEYVCGTVAYGYKRNPNDKHKLVVDENVATIVQKIFQLRAKGYSYRKIAIVLNEEKILSPREYYYQSTKKKNPFNGNKLWDDHATNHILHNEIYIGNIVQQKSTYISYKNKKVIKRDESEWIRVENMHEAIIDEDTWNAVQEINKKNYKCRTAKNGTVALFSGIIKCMDCGFSLRQHCKKYVRKDGSINIMKSYSCNNFSRSGKNACSLHWISEKVLIDFVQHDIQKLVKIVCYDEQKIIKKILKKLNADSESQQEVDKNDFLNAKNRQYEITSLMQKLYEDTTSGKISSNSYSILMQRYEEEQETLQEQILTLSKKINENVKNNIDVSKFINSVKKYMNFEELTREMLVELVEKIEVSENYIVDNVKHRDIKIYYKCINSLDELADNLN